jgi:Flp pilus assembly protein TadG
VLRRSLRHRYDGERGATLVIFVVVLTVLLAFAALAIDLGFGREKKRQVQNSADAAALAAAQQLPDVAAADQDAQDLTRTDLGGAASNWSTCTDAAALAKNAGHACISFDPSYTQVRVHEPTFTVPTFFAKVIGVNSLGMTASAVAQVTTAGLGSIEPFGMFASSGGLEQCIKDPSNGHSMPGACVGGPASPGNFGTLDVYQYGNAALGTTGCSGNGGQTGRLQNNIAVGVDHQIRTFVDVGSTVSESGCPPGPDVLDTRTGNLDQVLTAGLFGGTASDGGRGRLTRGPYTKTTVLGTQVDNKPLWQFIDPNATNIPSTCRRSNFPNGIAQAAAHAQLAQCFADYKAGNGSYGVLFGANTNPLGTERPIDLLDVQLSPRFFYVPVFSSDPNGNKTLPVLRFQAVFLQTIYGDCNGQACDFTFEPGPWNTAPITGSKAEATSAWVLQPGMVPAGVDRPGVIGSSAFLQLVK